MTKLCDIKDLSEYLDMSIPYLRKLVREKGIPHYVVGNRIKFNIDEINDWLKNKKQDTNSRLTF